MSWRPASRPTRRAVRHLGVLTAAVLLLPACSSGSASPTGSPTDSVAGSTPGTRGSATATVDATGTTVAAAPSPTLTAPPTPDDPGTRAVLTALDSLNSHGPYRITLLTDGATSYLDVVPPGSVHYHAGSGDTVGDEIAVDGAAWSRGPDGRWHTTDDVTHHGPQFTVADVSAVVEAAPGQDAGGAYRSYRVTGHDGAGAYQAVVTLRTTDGRLRDARLTGPDRPTTTYTITWGTPLKITPPPPSP